MRALGKEHSVLAMQTRPLIAALMVWSVAACRETVTAPTSAASTPAAPKPAAPNLPVASSLVAFTATIQAAAPATEVLDAPAVIVRDQFGVGMRDVSVSFVVASGGGSIKVTRTRTDANGLASSLRWVVGVVPGQNTMSASVDGVGSIAPVVFTAIGLLVPTDSATYALSSMGGRPLPVTYSGGGASWTFVGGRIVLAADATYTQVYVVATASPGGVVTIDSTSSLVRGTYSRNRSTITFYTDYDGAYLYMTGTINGNFLSIRYWDSVDFDDEEYVRASAPASARLSPVPQHFGRRPR